MDSKSQANGFTALMNSFQLTPIRQTFILIFPLPIIELVMDYIRPWLVLVAFYPAAERDQKPVPTRLELWNLHEQRCLCNDVVTAIDPEPSSIHAVLTTSNIIQQWFTITMRSGYTVGRTHMISISDRNDTPAYVWPVHTGSTGQAVKLPKSLQKQTSYIQLQNIDSTHHCFVMRHVKNACARHLLAIVDDRANVRWYMPGGYNYYCDIVSVELVTYSNDQATVIISLPEYRKPVIFDGVDNKSIPVDRRLENILLFYRIDVSIGKQINHTARFISFERARKPLSRNHNHLFAKFSHARCTFTLYDISSEMYEEHCLDGLKIDYMSNALRALFFHNRVLLDTPIVPSAYIASANCILWTFMCSFNRSRTVFLWRRGLPLRHLDELDPRDTNASESGCYGFNEIVGDYSPP